MATVPETHTFADGLAVTSEMNSFVRDPIAFLMNRPMAKLRQTVLQTLTTGVGAVITFTTEDLDDDPAGTGAHDTAVNTSRYTAVYAGWYWVSGGVSFASNATGVRLVRFLVNGTLLNDSDVLITPVSGNTTRLPTRGHLVFLNVGDYLEIQATQTSGGPLDTAVGSGEQSSMSVMWVRLA